MDQPHNSAKSNESNDVLYHPFFDLFRSESERCKKKLQKLREISTINKTKKCLCFHVRKHQMLIKTSIYYIQVKTKTECKSCQNSCSKKWPISFKFRLQKSLNKELKAQHKGRWTLHKTRVNMDKTVKNT